MYIVESKLSVRRFMNWLKFYLCFLIIVQSIGFTQTWRLDSRFAALDIIEMVEDNYPSLNQQAERISYYAGYYSVNPFLLAEKILITQEDAAIVAKKISRSIKNSDITISNQTLSKINATMKQYGVFTINKSASSHEMPAFDLPFDHSKQWFFNGVHTWNGEDDNGDPMSSLDLTRTWSLMWGDVTSDDWVAAATDGVVTKFSSCSMRVTHDSGWATDYYHLDNIQFTTGDVVKAGEKLANYANTLAQATCQGGHSTGPHVHFTLIHDGELASLSGIKLSQWDVHPGTVSYDSSPSRMWLIKNGEKKFAYQNTIKHISGDNEIDYRYNGMYSAQEINGHGINVSITQFESQDTIRNVVFVAFYSYDDNGNANFYAGNLDFDNWRVDESKTINMIQTSGGDFSNLSVVDFENDVVDAGTMQLYFVSCSELEVNFSLIEPISGLVVTKQLNLSKIIGVPNHVCQAPSLPINP